MKTPTKEEKEQVIKRILLKLLYTKKLMHPKTVDVLREMLINDKTLIETAQILSRPKSWVEYVYKNSEAIIIQQLNSLDGWLGNRRAIQEEIEELKSKLSRYEQRDKKIAALPKQSQDALALKVEDIAFSARARSVFKVAEIQTVEDLVKLSRRDLLIYRNSGRKTLAEIEEFLFSKGLRWKMDI